MFLKVDTKNEHVLKGFHGLLYNQALSAVRSTGAGIECLYCTDMKGFHVIHGLLYDRALSAVRSTGAGIECLYCTDMKGFHVIHGLLYNQALSAVRLSGLLVQE